jgi:hypothetical protein
MLDLRLESQAVVSHHFLIGHNAVGNGFYNSPHGGERRPKIVRHRGHKVLARLLKLLLTLKGLFQFFRHLVQHTSEIANLVP